MKNKISGQESAGMDVDVAMLFVVAAVLMCRSSDVGAQVPIMKKMMVRLSEEIEVFFRHYSQFCAKVHSRALTEEEGQAMARVKEHLLTSLLHFSAHEEHLEKFRKELKGLMLKGSINMDIGDLEEDTK